MKRAVVLAVLAGCAREPEKDPLDTEAYNAWKQTQILRRLPMARGGLEVKGRIDILPPDGRSKHPRDFCEVFVNGERVGKYNVAKLPDGSWPRIGVDVDFNSGPNTFDVWDSSTNRHYRQQVDTREAVEFLCVPTADGYDIQPQKKKQDQ
ncbi:MAG: hypothetical protein HY293_17520 [Planctomycetes bacterium]|nr:hypothetical protein [Planctomycetota bacterium]